MSTENPSDVREFPTLKAAVKASCNLGTFLTTRNGETGKRAWRLLGDCLEICTDIDSDWEPMKKGHLRGAQDITGRNMDWSVSATVGDPDYVAKHVW